MTAPVSSQMEGKAWCYQFVLPASYTINIAPRPLNPDVTLAEIKAKRVATLRYSGRATAKAQTVNAEKLIDWISAQGLVSQSVPRWVGYNAP